MRRSQTLASVALLALAAGCSTASREPAVQAQGQSEPSAEFVFVSVLGGSEPVGGLTADEFIVEEDGQQLKDIADRLESGELKSSVGLVINGLTEEGVREAYSKGLKGGLSGSVVVKIA